MNKEDLDVLEAASQNMCVYPQLENQARIDSVNRLKQMDYIREDTITRGYSITTMGLRAYKDKLRQLSLTDPVTPVREIRPEVDQDTVKALEDWLEDAKSGRLQGVVLLGNLRGDQVMHTWRGQMPLSTALLVWEQFKTRAIRDSQF